MSQNKHSLFLMYDGLTDPLGQSQVLPYIIGLRKSGYQFSIISFEKEKGLIDNLDSVAKLCNDNDINWLAQKYTKKPPILSTIFDLIIMYREVLKVVKSQNVKMIHCRSYLPALIAFMIKKKANIKILFDMRGFWADERVDGKLWNLSNPIFKTIYSFFKNKEKGFLNEADHVVSLTNLGKEEILSWPHISKKIEIDVIPCCVDTVFFDYSKITSEEIANTKNNLGIPKNHFVLSYLGSIGTWYMLDEMLDFFKVLQQKIPSSTFLLITTDDSSHIFKKCAEKNIAKEHIKIVSAKRAEVPKLVSVSEFSIFFITPSYSKKASSPTKQGELMSLGIPIICNDGVGDTSTIVRKYNSGIVVKTTTNIDYLKAVEEIEKFNIDKKSLRDGALDYFSLEKGVQKYHSIYKKILEN